MECRHRYHQHQHLFHSIPKSAGLEISRRDPPPKPQSAQPSMCLRLNTVARMITAESERKSDSCYRLRLPLEKWYSPTSHCKGSAFDLPRLRLSIPDRYLHRLRSRLPRIVN